MTQFRFKTLMQTGATAVCFTLAAPAANAQDASAGAPATTGAAPATAGAAGGASIGSAADSTFGLKPGPQRTLGFDDAMGLTVQNSFDLRVAQEQMFQTELLIRKAWSSVLPRLNANVGYQFSWPQISFQPVTQETLDRTAAAQRGQLEGQAAVYDAQAQANNADGDYNSEFANRAIAARLRQQAGGISAGKEPDGVAINPVNVFTGGLTFSMVLFNGRSIPLLLNAYDTVKQTRATMVRARSQALYLVATGYFNAVTAQRLVGISERQVKSLEEHLKVTRVRVEVGTLPMLALRRAESDLESAKASLRSSQSAYLSAVAALGNAMGVDTAFDVGQLPQVPEIEGMFKEDELVAHAEGNRPDIQAARLAVDIAERGRVDAMMQWMPTVNLQGRANATSNIRGFQTEPLTYAVLVTAAVPLYDGGERYTAWRESGSKVRQARLQLEQARFKVASAVRGNLREIHVRKENLVNQRAALELARASTRDSQARFSVGAATQLEVLDSENVAVSAELNLTLAELQLQTARLALAYVVGAFNPGLSDGTGAPRSSNPVDVALLPTLQTHGAEATGVAHLDPSAPAQAPSLAPAGRTGRSHAVQTSGMSLTPSPTDLLRAGLVEGTPLGMP